MKKRYKNCTRKKTCHSFEPCDKMNKVVRGGGCDIAVQISYKGGA
ncbi:hypothetical protein HMPREF9163_01362 [Selenomonas sp. oral taxon 138 str. F0429]|nr:hypothetical protein HMPREF9163_01362 [Selenomonas sp. oral taxon 138 str. F0429]